MKDFLRKHKMWFKTAAGIAAVALVTLLILAEIASRGAALIFNREMARQDVLRGFITVEKLYANLWGDVTFENLLWRDINGDVILEVPSGDFHVRPWDVITRNFKSTTIQAVTLNEAHTAVRFNEKMKVDFVKASLLDDGKDSDRERKEKKRKRSLEEKLANFNLGDRKLRMKLVLNNCKLESFYLQRHYVLEGVNATIDLNTAKKLYVDITAGKFGGTMVGGGFSLKGVVDFRQLPADCDLTISLIDVDPSSLGFGMNLHDKMSLFAKAKGPISRPVATGTLNMDELNIPALRFENVTGDIHYENGHLDFTDVHAKVYNGTLDAYGDYNIDTRVYNIYGKGKDLDSRIPLRNLRFKCLVALDITLKCDGNPRNTLTYGSFKSGKGNYSVIPFNYIQGEFNNYKKKLDFYNVVIDTPFGRITTDAFHIDHGKLHLNPIALTDLDTGERIQVVK